MAGLLTGGIAKTVGKAFSKLFLPATLTRYVTTVSPTNPVYDPAPAVASSFVCKAIHDTYSNYSKANGLVEAGDRKILILATSISVQPQIGDSITLNGETFRIVNPVETDPAKAVWVCQGRI